MNIDPFSWDLTGNFPFEIMQKLFSIILGVMIFKNKIC